MIPKVIHYCWFGHNPLPDLAIKCIDSWKRLLPSYEIKEWNEENFDVNTIPYVTEAYQQKKYAFVADYVRFYVLYREGGIYMDTDVEVLRSLDPFLEHKMFAGFESADAVAPGLILGSVAGTELIRILMESYSQKGFISEDGTLNLETVVTRMTRVLQKQGLILNGKFQVVGGMVLFPSDYFSPKDFYTGKIKITSNTYTIHHYSMSWLPTYKIVLLNLKRGMSRLLGSSLTKKLIALLKK